MDLKNFFVAVVACSLFACVVAGDKTVPADPTPAPTPSSSTDPSSTTSSTTAPATSTSTTPPPTTSTPPETTTTPAPSTSPAPAPTPTPAPVPSDGRGNWTVSNDSVTCIMAQMVVSAKITYPLVTVNKTGTAEVKVPASAKATGVCDPSHQNVQISWDKNTLELNFQKNDTTKMYFINLITLSVIADKETFPNISSELVGTTFTLERKLMEFKTNLNESYRCTREESLPLHKPNSTNNDGVLVLNKVQLQAFHDKAVPVFGNAQDCELDTPDIVPIAVGCALAALVFVVLIAYLVGRRRSQARGYLSM